MKDKKKTILNSIIFLFLIFVTYYIIFRGQNIYRMYKQINELNIFYVIMAVIIMLIYYLTEAINVKNILTVFKEKISLLKMLRYTFVSFFFSSITPGATGGQPMEVYYLKKEGIKVSNSTMAILIHLCGYHFSSIIFAIIGVTIMPEVLNNGVLYFFIFGTLLNLIPVTATIIGIFFPKLAVKIVGLLIKLLKSLKIKNIEDISEKINTELEIYQQSANYIKNNLKSFLHAMLLSTINMILYYSVPFFIYKAFGLSGKTIIDIVLLQAIIHGTVCSMPLPGTVGVTETVFLLVYDMIYPSHLLQSALLVNRFINFYLFVFVSLVVYIITKIKLDNKKNNLKQ